MKKKRKPDYFVLIIAASVFIVFLFYSVIFILEIKERQEIANTRYLLEATYQREVALGQKIKNDFLTLRALSETIASLSLDSDTDFLAALLGRINKKNDFQRMGVINKNGYASFIALNNTKDNNTDFSSMVFFLDALAGKESISDPVFDPETGKYVLYYGVPVKRGNDILAVLFAAISPDVFRDIISVAPLMGEGHFGIVNDLGTIIVPGADPNPKVYTGANIFTDIGVFTEKEFQRLKEGLKNKTPGNYSFSVNNVKQAVTLVPLEEINTWSVISAVGRSDIMRPQRNVFRGSIILIFMACAVFLYLIYWQIHTSLANQDVLEELAYKDPLTGGKNFVKFCLDAQEIIESNPNLSFAIWTFDTKNFDRINNIFGNEKGDLVLRRIFQVLGQNPPPLSVYCRISGDVFTGLRPYSNSIELVEWFWNSISSLANREVIADNQMRIDDAMGIYCIDDFKEKLSIADMVNNASLARRAAKLRTGNAVLFYSTSMGEDQKWKTKLEARGKTAVENGEITIFLQPKVSLGREFRIASAEVLARWIHPEYGWISPGDFVPLFENNGFIAEVDRYVFEEACKWYVTSRSSGIPEIKLAINVSRQGMLRDDFIDYYSSIKEKYGIADYALELEFTESVMLDDYDLFQNLVLALQDNGFYCSLDDFGSGFSSLNTLKNLPIDILKLDGLFFRNADERGDIVVSNFIRLACELGIKTVAEGVETPEQVLFLQKAGCDLVQGYIFSKPLPCDHFENLLFKTGGIFKI